MLEKAATIKIFRYSPLGSELKKNQKQHTTKTISRIRQDL